MMAGPAPPWGGGVGWGFGGVGEQSLCISREGGSITACVIWTAASTVPGSGVTFISEEGLKTGGQRAGVVVGGGGTGPSLSQRLDADVCTENKQRVHVPACSRRVLKSFCVC